MQSILLKIICWGLEMIMSPEELRQYNESVAMRNTEYSAIEMSRLNEVMQRRRNHSVTSVRDWYKSYGKAIPSPPSPPRISWACDSWGTLITSTVTLDTLDSDLFQDTTPPVSCYPSSGAKGVLRSDRLRSPAPPATPP
jgi:hypothetical protein